MSRRSEIIPFFKYTYTTTTMTTDNYDKDADTIKNLKSTIKFLNSSQTKFASQCASLFTDGTVLSILFQAYRKGEKCTNVKNNF